MKGIVLAGGLGTRLHPLTHATNKHLLPVYDKPMVYYPIQTLVDAGIDEIMIVTGGPHAGDFIKVLRNGEEFGLKKLSYAYQEGEGGIAAALAMAEPFVGNDSCAVILGDNILADDISDVVSKHNAMGGCYIFVKEVPDPERFGVVEYEPFIGNEIKNIIEKPENPPSNHAVIGVYLYDNTVFDRIRELKPSGRGELEVTDLNKSYLRDKKLVASETLGSWIDCGTFDSLANATAKFYEENHDK